MNQEISISLLRKMHGFILLDLWKCKQNTKSAEPQCVSLMSARFNVFSEKVNIKLYWVQRKKRVSKTTYAVALVKWHYEIREGLVKAGPNHSNYDSR